MSQLLPLACPTAPNPARPPSKNRVGGSPRSSALRAPKTRSQLPESHRVLRPAATTTASGRPVWPNRDPIGERGGVNLLGFVRNDSLNRIDFLGLDDEFEIFPTCKQDCYAYTQRKYDEAISSGELNLIACRALTTLGTRGCKWLGEVFDPCGWAWKREKLELDKTRKDIEKNYCDTLPDCGIAPPGEIVVGPTPTRPIGHEACFEFRAKDGSIHHVCAPGVKDPLPPLDIPPPPQQGTPIYNPPGTPKRSPPILLPRPKNPQPTHPVYRPIPACDLERQTDVGEGWLCTYKCPPQGTLQHVSREKWEGPCPQKLINN